MENRDYVESLKNKKLNSAFKSKKIILKKGVGTRSASKKSKIGKLKKNYLDENK
jgi:hypothetical protein